MLIELFDFVSSVESVSSVHMLECKMHFVMKYKTTGPGQVGETYRQTALTEEGAI